MQEQFDMEANVGLVKIQTSVKFYTPEQLKKETMVGLVKIPTFSYFWFKLEVAKC